MPERLDIPGGWQRISMRYAVVDSIGAVIGWAVIGVGATVPIWFANDMAMPAWGWLPLVVAGVLAAVGVVWAFLRTRTIGYLQRPDDLLVRRGMLFRRFVAVPYGRMQIVDITQGPIERMFGLKTLKFVTAAASSAITIPGMPGSTAEELRDHLVAVSESRRAGL
ncbi:PH domain-containing protein [Agrococcus sp. HG114]|uniref:PH domain-containing protein n=1 Tax=Agrococcus sp. HG114 TaxID=2969757 RepID=UPI00215B55A6|nr:PH domain-containing protein [Agrococcus sp. HG114]MCR8670060.1 PH domain-containing protein [Agrococcus sp. HG114]